VTYDTHLASDFPFKVLALVVTINSKQLTQTQEEVAETFKAEAQRDRANLQIKTTALPRQSTTKKIAEGEELKKFDDASYEDDLSDEENEDDEYDEDDDDMEDDELDEDEEVMTQCPDYCKCAGQYAAAMTATYVSAFLIGSLYNRITHFIVRR